MCFYTKRLLVGDQIIEIARLNSSKDFIGKRKKLYIQQVQ